MPNTIKTTMLKLFNEPIIKNTLILEEISEQSTPKINDSIIIENGLGITNDNLLLINKFVDFLQAQLNLKILPIIHLLATKKEGMTYGAYNPNDDLIYVLIKNRGIADALRTLAHETVHYKQKLENKIPPDLKERNLELESEANTKAGDIIYMFGLENKLIYNGNF